MKLTSKSTKAEILAAYEAAAARADSQYVSWPLVANTARLVFTEAVALAKDTYALGALCRKGFDALVDTYSQPVLQRK